MSCHPHVERRNPEHPINPEHKGYLMSEKITDERLSAWAAALEAFGSRKDFWTSKQDTVEMLSAVRELQERRASSPAAGKSADHEWDSFSNKWVPKPNAPAAGRDAVIEECAAAAEALDRVGREWVPDSIWDKINRDAAKRIRALKETPNGN